MKSTISRMEVLRFFAITLSAFAIFTHVLGKECTNTPTQLSSHTFRYDLLSSTNQSWRDEVFSQYHLNPTEDSTWMELLPRKKFNELSGEEINWAMLYRNMKNPVASKMSSGNGFLKEVSLHDVRLDPDSMHGQAQETNLEYLLMLDVDNLVWSFRKTAGLSTPGTPYGGWEEPTVELRGHFVGHYMSASAKMWASTQNDTLYRKMSQVVSALDACQKAMGTGYLSAFPSEEFDRFEAIQPVWAPYYTIHKIMQGLLDQYMFAANNEALRMVTEMANYFYKRVQNVISMYTIERHWTSLNEETGGMNDVLYKLYTVTGDENHLLLAHLFDKPCFLGYLAVKADELSGFHANTHIPVVVGSQMRYEVTGDPLYKDIGTYFMDIVNASHAYATGGTSVREFWSNPKHLADTLESENEESCTTYNLLKVSRNLFRWTKEMAYADHYERALTNGVLSIQRGREPGVMIYMLPLGKGVSKAQTYHGWGTKFNSFWCCYGTATESFSKLGDSIYFEEEGHTPGLYIIQFISSTFNWKSGQFVLNQSVEPAISSDPYLRVSFTISEDKGAAQSSTIQLRIPPWTDSNGAKATLNNEDLTLPVPGNFLSIPRKWSSNDRLTLQLPILLRTEAIKDERPEYASVQAILYGPYLLAGLSNGDWDMQTGTAKSLNDWIKPIPSTYNSQLFSLTQEVGNSTFIVSRENKTIIMGKMTVSGTDSAVHGTFRLIPKDESSSHFSSRKDLIGKSVTLEPFDLPGMELVQGSDSNSITFTHSGAGSSFRVIAGLDKKPDTISLELDNHYGCFIYSGVNYNVGESVKLRCLKQRKLMSDPNFNQAASFKLNEGMSRYHPISFTAKGAERNFLLMPLLSLRDESYTVYFNIGA